MEASGRRALRCQEEKTSQRKWTGQKLQVVKNSHKDEEMVTILCQFQFVKKFGFSCGESLWKSLWKMWKTLSYQQVFRCFEGEAAGIGKMELCLRFFDRRPGRKNPRKRCHPTHFRRKSWFCPAKHCQTSRLAKIRRQKFVDYPQRPPPRQKGYVCACFGNTFPVKKIPMRFSPCHNERKHWRMGIFMHQHRLPRKGRGAGICLKRLL